MKINRFWLCGALVMTALCVALVTTLQATALDFVKVSDVAAQPARFRGVAVKLTGTVVPGTAVTGFDEQGKTTLRFTVQDEQGAQLAVYHRGPRPDAFRDGGVVILEGALPASGPAEFRADTLLAKCPSRYEEELRRGEVPPPAAARQSS